MTTDAHEPWQWPEETWRTMVGRARAGRSLKPSSWPEGARCAVAISFDADHETIPLRDNDPSPMRISQGQYGNRQATPRIRKLLERESVPATFFYPAVSALLHPEEVRAIATDGHEIGIHSWIHEVNTTFAQGSRTRTDIPVPRHPCQDQRHRTGRDANRKLGFFRQHAGYHPRNETALRQQPDGR